MDQPSAEARDHAAPVTLAPHGHASTISYLIIRGEDALIWAFPLTTIHSRVSEPFINIKAIPGASNW